MENIENLKALRESLGYEGDALRTFVRKQQDRLRDEPLAKCEKLRVKEQHEHELLLKTHEKNAQEWEHEIDRECEEKEHECEQKAREFELQRKREETLKLNCKSKKGWRVKGNLSSKGSTKSAKKKCKK